MLKTIGAVVLGYVVIFVIVFLLFSAAYLAMGADRAFRPQSYEVSNLWVAISLILSLLAAVIGGAVAARVGRSDKAVVGLAVLVVVLGILMTLPTLMAPPSGEPEVRTAQVGNLEAMSKAKPPNWMSIMNPILGAVGVLVGGRLRKRPA